MRKIKLAILIGDREYEKRFVHCLMNYYREQFEISLFSGMDQWLEHQGEDYDLLVFADAGNMQEFCGVLRERGQPVLYLMDPDRETDTSFQQSPDESCGQEEGRELWFVDKYQDVNEIVSEILKHIGDEITEVQKHGTLPVKTRLAAVYALTENEYQLPFAITLASILGEQDRVLVIDLQENSGLGQLAPKEYEMGLEEILVMADSDTFSKSGIHSCIGQLEKMEYIYPAQNTECLSEADAAVYLKMIQMIIQEMEYGAVILNLGSRFQGFFEVLGQCQDIYLIVRKGGLCQWREYEFMEELQKKGYHQLESCIHRTELPFMSSAAVSCERLIEQWKWNEFGDLIRRSISGRSGGLQVGG